MSPPRMRTLPLLIAAALSACAGPGYRDPGDSGHVEASIGDRNVASRVRVALSEDPATAPYDAIRVTCRDGVVSLEGEVDRPDVRERVVRVARGVEGVRGVEDRISVRSPSG